MFKSILLEIIYWMSCWDRGEILKNLEKWNRLKFLQEPYLSYLCDIEGMVPYLAPFSKIIILKNITLKFNINLALDMEPVDPCVTAFNFKGFLAIEGGSISKNFL